MLYTSVTHRASIVTLNKPRVLSRTQFSLSLIHVCGNSATGDLSSNMALPSSLAIFSRNLAMRQSSCGRLTARPCFFILFFGVHILWFFLTYHSPLHMFNLLQSKFLLIRYRHC